MPITITFISLKKGGAVRSMSRMSRPKKGRGGAFNANNAKP